MLAKVMHFTPLGEKIGIPDDMSKAAVACHTDRPRDTYDWRLDYEKSNLCWEDRMTRNLLAAVMLAGMSSLAFGQQTISAQDRTAVDQFIVDYVSAINRHDAAAASAAFADDAIRATPAGFIRGREGVRKALETAINAGFHDLSVKVDSIKAVGNVIWYSAEWKAKVGDGEPHGNATIILIREADGSMKAQNECYNLALPATQNASDK
jgi:ketosteroid isomerase-like protein